MAVKKSDKNQRRKPRQARSLAKYEAILRVAPQLLKAHGYQKTTTELIALEAEVSIGTLYEYFSDKDDVFAVYLKQQTDRIMAAVASQVSNNLDAPTGDMLEALVNLGVDFVFRYQDSFSVIIREIPALWEIEVIRKLEARVIELARQYYQHRTGEPVAEGEVVATMLTNVVVGFYMRLALLGAQGLPLPTIKQELLTLIRGYLQQRAVEC